MNEAKLGYKQELRRSFSMIEIFGIAFSIMGLLPSIASTLAYSIPSGPVGMVWGWFIASGLIFVVGLAMVNVFKPASPDLGLQSSGGSRIFDAYFGGFILVDFLFREYKDATAVELPRRL